MIILQRRSWLVRVRGVGELTGRLLARDDAVCYRAKLVDQQQPSSEPRDT